MTAADGLRLALRRVGKRGGDPVVLTHGTFSNHRSCMGLAAFLAKEGFDCWVLDWRGHGASEHPNRPHSFDDIALLDAPAVIDAVTSRSGRPDLYWVGHSGGGLIAGMWMARFPKLASRHIKGLVMLASQATGAARSLRHRANHGDRMVAARAQHSASRQSRRGSGSRKRAAHASMVSVRSHIIFSGNRWF